MGAVRSTLVSDTGELLDRLTAAAISPEDITRQHPWRVARTAARLGEILGMNDVEARLLEGAARYHDIGKIGIPAELLIRSRRLTPVERRLVESHTTIGHQILSGGRSPLLRYAAIIALTHHERWDGHGYPRGLRGDAIPLAGRIVAVADAWDVLTDGMVPRRSSEEVHALTELGRHAGAWFDPSVVDALLRVLTERAAAGTGAAAVLSAESVNEAMPTCRR